MNQLAVSGNNYAMNVGQLGAVWGVSGVVLILVYAIARLTVITLEAFDYSFAWWHWVLLVLNVVFMAHSEGYKGFHKAFAPRVVARSQVIAREPTFLRVLFAPLFCMCYFGANRRQLAVTYLLTSGIVVLITVFQQLDQPLRGVLDAGVVVGLSLGVASIAWFTIQVLTGRPFDFPPELPKPSQPA